jgi:MarR family transcriptional regulator, 2-MHQ and catechol-resistance regulon repressor
MQKNGVSGASITGPKLWVVLARAYGALASYVQDRIAAEGIGLSDFMVLEVLLHKGPMSISAIGEKVLLANASMTAAVDRLEEKRLVLRQSSESDRRSKVVTLTPEGRSFISELYARHVRDIDAVTCALSQREQDQLRSLLKKLGFSAKAATWQRAQEPRRLSRKQLAGERQR